MCRPRGVCIDEAMGEDDDIMMTAATTSSESVAPADPLVTNVRHLHPVSTSFELVRLGEFTELRRLARGIHGDVFSYRWSRKGCDEAERHVAVKKLRREAVTAPGEDVECDDRKAHLGTGRRRRPDHEDALTEIGVLQRFSKHQEEASPYILRLLGLYQDNAHVWLVTDLAEGGELFKQIEEGGPFSETRAAQHSWEILQALSYLDHHDIGHRDISLENVLLKGGSACVMDFGMAVQSRATCGTPLRYFRTVGKPGYRAPECYVPEFDFVDVMVPAGANGGEVVSAAVHRRYMCQVRLPAEVRPNFRARAQVYGYTVPPADIFAAGVCLFIMVTGAPPWVDATLQDDRFRYARANGLLELRRSWGLPDLRPELADVLLGMTIVEPARRWTAEACLSSPCFDGSSDAGFAQDALMEARQAMVLSMAGA